MLLCSQPPNLVSRTIGDLKYYSCCRVLHFWKKELACLRSHIYGQLTHNSQKSKQRALTHNCGSQKHQRTHQKTYPSNHRFFDGSLMKHMNYLKFSKDLEMDTLWFWKPSNHTPNQRFFDPENPWGGVTWNFPKTSKWTFFDSENLQTTPLTRGSLILEIFKNTLAEVINNHKEPPNNCYSIVVVDDDDDDDDQIGSSVQHCIAKTWNS